MKLSLYLALFVATALAAPHKRSTLQDRVSRRRTTPPKFVPGPSKFVDVAGNQTQVEYSGNWAGAVITSPPSGQTFTGVTAQFVVPTPQVPSGGSGSYSASGWVGIDGDTYQNAILQTGIDFTADSSGGVSYDAWYEWFPDYAYDFSGISINAGDTVQLTVMATSSTTGTCQIDNLSNGQSVSQSLSSSSALGGQNAEWIVEDFEQGSSDVPFANFGTVQFTSASYTSSGGSGGVSGATILDIEQNGQVLTDVTIPSNSEVDVKYV